MESRSIKQIEDYGESKIRMKLSELEFKMLMNERLYDLAEAVIHYYNPCQRSSRTTCLVIDRLGDVSKHCCFHSDGNHCPFYKNEVCQFKCVRCKIMLCRPALLELKNPECLEDLKDIERIALRYGLTRRPCLGDRYVGMTIEVEAMAKWKNKGE